MELKLNLGGITLRLSIDNYVPTDESNWDYEWCLVELSLVGRFINYRIRSAILLSSEVDILELRLNELLADQIIEITTLEFIEPELKFKFFPKRDLRKDPGIICVKPGYEIEDIAMSLGVAFWDDDGALTKNTLNLMFYREEIEYLSTYLGLVKGSLDKDNPSVQRLVQQDVIRSV